MLVKYKTIKLNSKTKFSSIIIKIPIEFYPQY